MKSSIFAFEKSLYILQGQVFVMVIDKWTIWLIWSYTASLCSREDIKWSNVATVQGVMNVRRRHSKRHNVLNRADIL